WASDASPPWSTTSTCGPRRTAADVRAGSSALAVSGAHAAAARTAADAASRGSAKFKSSPEEAHERLHHQVLVVRAAALADRVHREHRVADVDRLDADARRRDRADRRAARQVRPADEVLRRKAHVAAKPLEE